MPEKIVRFTFGLVYAMKKQFSKIETYLNAYHIIREYMRGRNKNQYSNFEYHLFSSVASLLVQYFQLSSNIQNTTARRVLLGKLFQRRCEYSKYNGSMEQYFDISLNIQNKAYVRFLTSFMYVGVVRRKIRP